VREREGERDRERKKRQATDWYQILAFTSGKEYLKAPNLS
jgi:hypothetical protein